MARSVNYLPVYKSVVAAFMLLLAFALQPAVAQNAPVSTVANVSTTATTASVDITGAQINDIASCNLQLLYNPDIATAINVLTGSELGGTINIDLNIPGRVRFGWFDWPGFDLDDETVLFTIVFEKVADGTTFITWDHNDPSYPNRWADSNFTRLNDEPKEDFYIEGSLTFGTGVAVNLKVFLEGFYDPAEGKMRKAQDFTEQGGLFDKFPGTIADKITVELHDPNNYGTPVHVSEDIDLNQDGTASFFIEEAISGDYYLTVRHRNHLETVSAVPLDFDQAEVNYDFTTSADQAFGSNQKQIASGVYGIFAGDINQDGEIDINDSGPVIISVRAGDKGYIVTNITGDGEVDIGDSGPVIVNVRAGIGKITP